MCGIVGYVGRNGAAKDVLLNGLRRLEYRGYDSAGVALLEDNQISVCRSVGKVEALVKKVGQKKNFSKKSHMGIAHTRWATHGAPTDNNAHPHLDDTGKFACVHNGIIENYKTLREHLIEKGHKFSSETDSEVIPHLISEFYKGDFCEAVVEALSQLRGAFGIAVMCQDEPGTMIVARKGSPIVIGVGKNETIIASDVSAIVAHTSNVIFLDDGDMALINNDNVDIRNLSNVPINREVNQVDWDIEAVEKGGYEHFMLKEIHEQPDALLNATRGRVDHVNGTAILSGMNMEPQDIVFFNRIILAACGTSLHAGMVGEYYFEELAGIVTEVEQAAEFRYRNPILNERTLVITISQSGETADTLAALREAKLKGSQLMGICNAVGSTIAREAGRGVYLHAGPEISVASTKAFTCQTIVLLLMALKFARTNRMTQEAGIAITNEIERLPELVNQLFKNQDEIERIAKKWAHVDNMFYIGRGYLYPAALEGALKLKEISYIHAEGYNAAELKHGPIALLQEDVPVLTLLNDIPGKDKTIGNVQECMARKSPVILTATEGDEEVKDLSEDIIWVPAASRYITPILTVVALQLFSYFIAKERGCAIDQPRNLAKSVTVE